MIDKPHGWVFVPSALDQRSPLSPWPGLALVVECCRPVVGEVALIVSARVALIAVRRLDQFTLGHGILLSAEKKSSTTVRVPPERDIDGGPPFGPATPIGTPTVPNRLSKLDPDFRWPGVELRSPVPCRLRRWSEVLSVEGDQEDRAKSQNQNRAKHDLHRHRQPPSPALQRLALMVR
jgi:hypothetical protein